jgi:hypothetical protein
MMEAKMNKRVNVLQVERFYSPHNEAMLAALRLVLGLPQIPVILEEEKK